MIKAAEAVEVAEMAEAIKMAESIKKTRENGFVCFARFYKSISPSAEACHREGKPPVP